MAGSTISDRVASAWARADAVAAAGFDAAGLVGDAAHRQVAALHAWSTDGGEAGTAVVQPPDPRTGRHDSLWRIAARELGDGSRWPEMFALNRGDPQPGGRRFEQPGLVFPGEHLQLPTTNPQPPGNSADDRDHPSAPGPTPAAPRRPPPTSGNR